jgi:putative Mn2+ efflux pump MntP
MFGLVLIAAALGLSNFAAAIGIGLSGIDARVRVRVGLVFGLFEATMPLLGLVLGRQVATSLGSTSAYVGGGLLIATGSYTVLQARRHRSDHASVGTRLGRLLVTGAALSIDNLVVGFALGTHKVPLALAAVVIAVVSVAMSLVGLELGRQLGRVVEKWSNEIGGAVLILVGVTIALGLF